MTAPTFAFRSAKGFSEMNMRAVLAAVPPSTAAAGVAARYVHFRVAFDYGKGLGELRDHGLIGDVLVRLHGPRDAADVLLREKAFRHDEEQVAVSGNGNPHHEEHQSRVAQRPPERDFILAAQPVKRSLAYVVGAAVGGILPRPEHSRTHH